LEFIEALVPGGTESIMESIAALSEQGLYTTEELDVLEDVITNQVMSLDVATQVLTITRTFPSQAYYDTYVENNSSDIHRNYMMDLYPDLFPIKYYTITISKGEI
jgi:hypothetical protein